MFGIVPYFYDDKKGRWYAPKLMRFYSISVLIFHVLVLITCILVVSDDIEKETPSKTLYFAAMATCVVMSITLTVAYSYQLKHSARFIEFANDLKLIFEQITVSCNQSDYRSLLIISVKVTWNNLLNCVVTIIEIRRLSSVSPIVRNNVFLQIANFCPSMVLMMLPTMFYSVLLVLEHAIKRINSVVAQIVADSSVLLNINKELEQRKMYTMCQSCSLSDRIDNISLIYSSLYNSTVTLNKVLNVQMLASNWSAVSSLVLKLYLLFYIITTIAASTNYISLIMDSLNGLFNQFLYIYGTCLVATTCLNISKEVLHFGMSSLDLLNVLIINSVTGGKNWSNFAINVL